MLILISYLSYERSVSDRVKHVHKAGKLHEFGALLILIAIWFFFRVQVEQFYPHLVSEVETNKKSCQTARIALWVQRPGYGLVCTGFFPGKGKRLSVLQNIQTDCGPHPVYNWYRGSQP
jgi:hypothetical protein